MNSTFAYLKNLAKDKNIGSITPTSSFGVKRILRKIDFNKAKLIVEYGPGLGVITKKILQRLKPNGRLIAIEANPQFAKELRKRIRDPRLIVIKDSAENVLKILDQFDGREADYIVSGIPFSFFNTALKDRILSVTKLALGSKGKFLVYQFVVPFSLPKTDIKHKIKEHMILLKEEFEILNIPPLRIYEAIGDSEFAKRAVNY